MSEKKEKPEMATIYNKFMKWLKNKPHYDSYYRYEAACIMIDIHNIIYYDYNQIEIIYNKIEHLIYELPGDGDKESREFIENMLEMIKEIMISNKLSEFRIIACKILQMIEENK
jgi:hypothetical protein